VLYQGLAKRKVIEKGRPPARVSLFSYRSVTRFEAHRAKSGVETVFAAPQTWGYCLDQGVDDNRAAGSIAPPEDVADNGLIRGKVSVDAG
jgi:hypothetical protein